MPISRNFNLQWLNENSQRSYPITDESPSKDVTGTVTIPDSFIVGLVLPVHAGLDVNPEKFFIHTLGIYPTGYVITFAYDNAGVAVTVGTVQVSRDTHVENASYAFPGVDDFSDTVGRIAIGTLKEIDRLPPGVYTFNWEATNLEVDSVRPIIRGISSITVVTGNDRSDRIYGDVVFVAGTNMRITVSQVSGQPAQVVFSAIDGEGLNETCECDEEAIGPCIRYINGIPPLPNGNFRMIGDECLNLEPLPNGLRLNDVCSAPCCGCEELNALVSQIHRFADGEVTMRGFLGRLQSAVDNMASIVLGSRLSDGAGCIECQ